MSDVALAPKPKRVPLKALPAAAFQHPLIDKPQKVLKRSGALIGSLGSSSSMGLSE